MTTTPEPLSSGTHDVTVVGARAAGAGTATPLVRQTTYRCGGDTLVVSVKSLLGVDEVDR